MHEIRARLDQLRSLIHWTAPLYLILFAGGLFASRFAFGSPLFLLLAILVAFTVLDATVLTRIARIETASIRTDVDLRSTREEIDRLARLVLVAGVGLGVAFVAVFAFLMLTT